jgi:LmbE family N-acetylglucosaminyl deacetylase
MSQNQVAIAIGAHPDDIEFMMAGTLLLLKAAGFETHYLTVANGSCGSLQHGPAALRRIRRQESEAAAQILGAVFHPSLVDDLEVLYELKQVRRLGALLRRVKPSIILTHPPYDYMEDHTNTCRLVVTAAFALGAPNFRTLPPRAAVHQDVALYHTVPHRLLDGFRQLILPEAFVNVTSVFDTKLAALAKHQSQQHWLEASQGMNSYLKTMETESLALGKLSGRFRHAEGWRRHLHLGYSQTEIDPLKDLLGAKYAIHPKGQKLLRRPY